MVSFFSFLVSIAQWLNCSSRHPKSARIAAGGETEPLLDHSPQEIASDDRVVYEVVRCDIILNYADGDSDTIPGVRIRWTDPSMTDFIQQTVNDFLQQGSRDLDFSHLNRDSGRCSLVKQQGEKVIETKHWSGEEQWKEDIPLMIMRFHTTEVKVPFYLKIYWDYAGLLPPIRGEAYAETVHKAIMAKMSLNWKKDSYISRSNLGLLLSKHTINELIDRDNSLKTWPPDTIPPIELKDHITKDMFKEYVWSDAIRLLALHVWAGLPLVCLYQMMIQKGKKDSDLVKDPLGQMHCPRNDYAPKFETLIAFQGRFFAYQFKCPKRLPEHVELHRGTVVPILTSAEDKLGEGGFAKVYRVSVEAGHHPFDCDKGCHFAMKEFDGFGRRPEQGFRREATMLQVLSKFPHPHITLHLASWTQNDKFYMLFPLAKCNLRSFLSNTPAQDLSKDHMLWLMSQLVGLADGVRQIHNLGPAVLGNLGDTTTGKSQIAFHHDLKPENILVFLEAGGRQTFKISDFGSAKVTQMLSSSRFGSNVSYKTPGQSPGDPNYGAPEVLTDKATSRPYDIWSLGCIYLEILLWVFPPRLNDFYLDRLLDSRLDKDSHESPAFWYRSKNETPKLKPAVIRRLKMLQERCSGCGFFEELIKVIGRMLIVPPKDRIAAPVLYNALDAMRKSATIELDADKNAYMKEKMQHPAFAIPPSATNAIDELSSNDEHESELSSSSQLDTNGHHRTKSDGKLLAQSRMALKRNSVSDPKRLHPIETKNLPQIPGRPRSPSVTISHADEPESVIDGLSNMDDYENHSPIGAQVHQWGREDFHSNGRPRKRSFSEGDEPAPLPCRY